MSYQVLARKWRPRSFETLVGQEHVVRALAHALQQGRLHHAYLFTGTRGVGKTTIARILAKSLNCETGVSATPCGVCSACQEIDAGRFVDLLEVDAATNTRVDEMRQLLENAVYAPTRGRYKVYVIDEVHMLSNAAFNAMLKTLEEPPEHVKFILATTDPQKIPVTVLSRCLQFNLKQMAQSAIVDHLTRILGEEGVAADETALRLVARAANGSMRDALSLLDQAIAYGAGEVRFEGVSSMLGTFGNAHLLEIVDALIASDPGSLKKITEGIARRSLSFDAALSSLAELWVHIQAAQLGCSLAEDEPESGERIAHYSASLSPEYVQMAYGITVQGRAQLALAPDPEAGFLMTLLRLYAFRPASEGGGEKKNSKLALDPERPARGAEIASAPLASPPGQQPVMECALDANGNESVGGGEAAQSTDWSGIVAGLNLAGLARELAAHCELLDRTSNAIRLRLSSAHRHLLSKSSQDKLQTALMTQLQVGAVVISVGETASETPAQKDSRLKGIAQETAQEAIERDEVVRGLIEVFDATLIDSSIRPLSA